MRPDLLDCAVPDTSNLTDCENEKYGEIDEELFDKTGTFTIDQNTWFIFVAEDANVALDNIHVVVAPKNETDDDESGGTNGGNGVGDDTSDGTKGGNGTTTTTETPSIVTDIRCNESLTGTIDDVYWINDTHGVEVALFNFTQTEVHDVTFSNCGR